MSSVFDLFATLKLDSSDYEQGLDFAERRANGFGSALKGGLETAAKVGTAAMGVATGAVGLFAKQSVDTGAAFDASMSQVSAISGAVGDELAALRDKAIDMGGSTRFSASEAADAMSYMAMAGWKTSDMLDGISGIMSLAAAAGEDLATTSDIVTDALTAFGLTAADSGDFANVLAAASSNANTNVSMMGETFKYVAPLAGSLNIGYQDMAEAIGLVANAGIKGSQAGTTLRSILTRLSTDAGASSTSLGALGTLTEKLGVAFYDSEGHVRDFSDVLDETRAAWQDLDAVQASEYATQIAGQEALSGWLALMAASPADIEKLRGAINTASNEMDGFNGAAAAMADKMEANLPGAITAFGSAVETLRIRVADNLTPILTDFVSLGTGAVRAFTDALNDEGLDAAMLTLKQPISDGIARILEIVPDALAAGSAIVSAIGSGLMENASQVAKGAAELVALSSAKIIERAPEFIKGAGTLVSTFVDELVKNAPMIGPAALNLLAYLGQSIVDGLPTLAAAAVDTMSALGSYLSENAPELLEAALSALSAFSGSLRENAGMLVDGALALILALAGGLIDSLPVLLEQLPTIVSNIAGVINDNAPKLIVAGLQLIGMLAAGIVEAIPALIENFPRIIAAIFDVILAVNWLGLGASIIKGIGSGIASLIHEIPSALAEIGKTAIEWLGPGLDWASAGSYLIDTILAGIRGLVGIIPNALANIGRMGFDSILSIDWGGLGIQIVAGLASGIAGAAKSAIDSLVGVAEMAFEAAKNFLGIRSPSKKAREELGAFIPPGMALGIEDGEDEVTGAMEQVGSLILHAFDGMDFGLGLGDKVASALDTVQAALDESSPTLGVDLAIGQRRYEQPPFDELPPLMGEAEKDEKETVPIIFEIDGEQFAKIMYKYNKREEKRRGVHLAEGVV